MHRTPSKGSVVGAVLVASFVPALVGCAARSGADDDFPGLNAYAGQNISDVDFVGGEPFGSDTLQAIIATRPTRCSLLGLPICIPFTGVGRQRHELSPGAVREDVNRLTLFYRREGYFGTTVRPELAETAEGVRVTFDIERAAPAYLKSLSITGVDGVFDADSLARRLPSRPGEIFNLTDLAASADTVLRAVQWKGYARAEILRNFDVDAAADSAEATLDVITGPVVTVDSILVRGAEALSRRAVLRQLNVRDGDTLRLARLVESAQNLYALPIVQFATVAVAPDSLQVEPGDGSRATVLVQIAEATVHQVDAEIGWGSVECFRALARWESRNFHGGGRRLVLEGTTDKVGIGQGLGGSVCTAFEADTFASSLDYGLSAELTQPYFMSARNALSLRLLAERQSEPLIYQREAIGGRFGVTRRIGPRTYFDTGVEIQRGATFADPVLFCGAFLVCDPETIGQLEASRWRNVLAAGLLQDRTDVPINATRGHIARTRLGWAPSWLGSDVTFVRWTVDYSRYRQLRSGVVLAASIRTGDLFRSASPADALDFLPPEDRFFAGGSTTVRGYGPNELGPGLYVTEEIETDENGTPSIDPQTGGMVPDLEAAVFVPTGGTSLLILNGELRLPSPFLSRIARLAVFVDAGAVTTRQLWAASLNDIKVTPGVGVRVHTPVGPVRVDLAYNPNDPVVGPLFLADPETDDLILIQERFRPATPSFLRRFRLYVAIGQAF